MKKEHYVDHLMCRVTSFSSQAYVDKNLNNAKNNILKSGY
jgi:hypothetical protein